MQQARELFDRVASCGSDLGLFPEEYDGDRRELLGNFPQGLSHLSHIAAAVALAQPYGPGSAVAQHAFQAAPLGTDLGEVAGRTGAAAVDP